ncbi:MAG: ribosome silencing factor [Alphaproteobacteria bacterium]
MAYATRPKTKGLPKKSGRNAATRSPRTSAPAAMAVVLLENLKAECIITIPLAGKSTMADDLVIATALNPTHATALAKHVKDDLVAAGYPIHHLEGLGNSEWIVVDAGDSIIHIFTAEAREKYNLEKMWSYAFKGE